jgi:hypothetical protein
VCGKTDPCRCVRPEGHSDRQDRAALIEQSLSEYGLLAPVQEREGETVEELAQWLAEVSQFPRYTVADGWKRILQSEADIDIATVNARTKVTGAEAQRLTTVRVILLRHVRQMLADQAAEGTGSGVGS